MNHDVPVPIYHNHLHTGVLLTRAMSDGPSLPQIALPRSCRTFESLTEVPKNVFVEASGQAPMLVSAGLNN